MQPLLSRAGGISTSGRFWGRGSLETGGHASNAGKGTFFMKQGYSLSRFHDIYNKMWTQFPRYKANEAEEEHLSYIQSSEQLEDVIAWQTPDPQASFNLSRSGRTKLILVLLLKQIKDFARPYSRPPGSSGSNGWKQKIREAARVQGTATCHQLCCHPPRSLDSANIFWPNIFAFCNIFVLN